HPRRYLRRPSHARTPTAHLRRCRHAPTHDAIGRRRPPGAAHRRAVPTRPVETLSETGGPTMTRLRPIIHLRSGIVLILCAGLAGCKPNSRGPDDNGRSAPT